MIRPALLLLSAGLLAAPAPGVPAEGAQAPVRALCLAVRGTGSAVPGLDPQRIASDLSALLTGGGIAVIPASAGATTPGAYRLDLAVDTTVFPEGSRLLSVQGSMERLTELDSLVRGEEFRWTGLSQSAHAAGEDLPAEARRVSLLVAASLIGKAKAARSLATSESSKAPLTASLPFPLPPSLLPACVEVEFSPAQVQHQPSSLPYPPAARAAGIQGTVLVNLTVDPEGRPVRAVAESGPPELKVAALRYALQWRLQPARTDGAAQWTRYRLPVAFQLAPPVPAYGNEEPRRR